MKFLINGSVSFYSYAPTCDADACIDHGSQGGQGVHIRRLCANFDARECEMYHADKPRSPAGRIKAFAAASGSRRPAHLTHADRHAAIGIERSRRIPAISPMPDATSTPHYLRPARPASARHMRPRCKQPCVAQRGGCARQPLPPPLHLLLHLHTSCVPIWSWSVSHRHAAIELAHTPAACSVVSRLRYSAAIRRRLPAQANG